LHHGLPAAGRALETLQEVMEFNGSERMENWENSRS